MTSKDNAPPAAATGKTSSPGPWEAMALAQLREWDPAWAEAAERVTQNPWKHEVLPRKTVELVGLAVNAACTNLNPEGTPRTTHRSCGHSRRADPGFAQTAA